MKLSIKKGLITISVLALITTTFYFIRKQIVPQKKPSQSIVELVPQYQPETQLTKQEKSIQEFQQLTDTGKPQIIHPKSQAEVEHIYKNITMLEIPHIFIDSLPPDWQIRSTADKTLFMKIITALILHTNEKIQAEKLALQQLQEKHLRQIEWTQDETDLFNHLVKKYDVFLTKKRDNQLKDLFEKVDIIPPSIAVAQAILFTDWGRKNQKSIYGEYGWTDKTHYEPLPFDSLVVATDSFAAQLNSRTQLLEFRELRNKLIPYANVKYLGPELVYYIHEYMDWDKNYPEKIQNVYQQGLIKELDHAQFKTFPSE